LKDLFFIKNKIYIREMLGMGIIFSLFGMVFTYYIILSIIPDNNKQRHHVDKILESKELQPLASDYYFYRNKPFHTFPLCGMIYNFVTNHSITTSETSISLPMKQYVSGPSSNDFTYLFTKEESVQINEEFMKTVYSKKNFPYTYRYDVYVNFDNFTINKLYKVVCTDYYKIPDLSIMPRLFSGLAIGLFVMRSNYHL